MTAQELEKLLAEVTPGEWVMETVRTSCGVCHKIGPWPHAWRHGEEMSACIYDDYPSPQDGTNAMKANARLIAMAPTLARRVIAAEKLAEALADVLSDLTIGAHPQLYMQQIKQALAEWDAAQ